MQRPPQWPVARGRGPVASPTAADLFHSQRCLGGVLTLYALWNLVGEETFARIDHTFVDRYRNADASTQDCIAVASEVSGQDLSGFLGDWLYGTKTPRMPGHPDGTVTPPRSTIATPREELTGAPKGGAGAALG
ncbi:hypothetical protein [Streptomyces sp. NPDC088554]|uniref:hypothetical protein n=1 Tax=Streptomyces sp. NPDC088554 TaxID=3365865 RepID=UPI0037F660D4